MAGKSIDIQSLEKRFGPVRAVQDFQLRIAAGEFVSVLGASGSGKTTVLRMIAGLEEPTSGRIFIDGRDATELPPEKREIGIVFQDYALFPHMTVQENVAFPLRMRRLGKAALRRKVDQMLELVGIGELGSRRIAQLSGGQQQRAALARALVFEPALLLLDEPLSALDKNLREYMKAEIKSLHRRMGVTIIYVTHDQSEALALSDRVVVMRHGRILDVDRPDRLYSLPASPYLAEFIGDANLVDARVECFDGSAINVAGPLGRFSLAASQIRLRERPTVGLPVKLVIRPENIVIDPAEAGLFRIICRIEEMLYNGAHTIYSLAVEDSAVRLVARCGQHQIGTFQPGITAEVGIRVERSVVVGLE